MYNTFKPTGNMVQLIDGRVFKKNQKNLWEDINTGVAINEQTLNIMISSASFSADASGGGSRKASSSPGPSTSLSAPFDDIVATSSPTENANRTIVTTEGPVTLRLTFAAGTYNTSAVDVYKNDTQFRNIRISSSPPSPVTLSETFANGDQLKFSVTYSTQSLNNFDVTIEKIEPGSVQVLDTFNVSIPAP